MGGTFHPKESHQAKAKAGLKAIPHIEALEGYDRIAEKYTDGPDEPRL